MKREDPAGGACLHLSWEYGFMDGVPMERTDPDLEARVRDSFARQRVMELIGARLARVAPGEVEVELPFRGDLTQQHGFLHAGVVTTVLDTAAGYAAFTLMAADASVVSVEFKTNLLAPARGELLRVRARVVRAGRTLTVTHADAFMHEGGREVHVATFTGTMMAVAERGPTAHTDACAHSASATPAA